MKNRTLASLIVMALCLFGMFLTLRGWNFFIVDKPIIIERTHQIVYAADWTTVIPFVICGFFTILLPLLAGRNHIFFVYTEGKAPMVYGHYYQR